MWHVVPPEDPKQREEFFEELQSFTPAALGIVLVLIALVLVFRVFL